MDFQVDENEIYSGKVVYFKQKEGYGFIRSEMEIDDVYVHYTEIEKGKPGFKNLLPGDTVTFKMVENGDYTDQKTGETKKKYRALDLNIVRTLGA